MVLGRADAAAPGHAQHHRATQTAAGAVAHARGMADDVIDHRIHEAVELRFGNRLHALRGQTDRQAGDGGFIQRRIDDALGPNSWIRPEVARNTPPLTPTSSPSTSTLGVVAHFVGHGLGQRFDQGDGGHQRFSQASACARCSATSCGSFGVQVVEHRFHRLHGGGQIGVHFLVDPGVALHVIQSGFLGLRPPALRHQVVFQALDSVRVARPA